MTTVPQTPSEARALAKRLFTPSAPVTNRELFIGRQSEIADLEDACETPGRHAVLFGERGVGKTSLASIFLATYPAIAHGQMRAAKTTCNSTDDYPQVMRNLLRQIRVPVELVRKVGFQEDTKLRVVTLDRFVGEDANPMDLVVDLSQFGEMVLVVDEFDRLKPSERARFADALKVLSDNVAPITLVLVGVAENIDGLVKDHASSGRAIAQIRLRRLSLDESRDVIERRLPLLGFNDSADIAACIAHLAQGLPHFLHLVALGAVLDAIQLQSRTLTPANLSSSVRAAINQADQSIISAYNRATYSPRVDALYTKVLCACAMAEVDTEGYFNARQVLPHMQRLHGTGTKVAQFTKHLDEFSTPERGLVLEKSGGRRKFRYRFLNPMLKAYVLIQAVADQKVALDQVRYIPARRVVAPLAEDLEEAWDESFEDDGADFEPD